MRKNLNLDIVNYKIVSLSINIRLYNLSNKTFHRHISDMLMHIAWVSIFYQIDCRLLNVSGKEKNLRLKQYIKI